MKTAVQEVIDAINRCEEQKLAFTYKGLIFMLENALEKERTQIETAVEEGIKYGNSLLQTFDYPAARYYSHTYLFQ